VNASAVYFSILTDGGPTEFFKLEESFYSPQTPFFSLSCPNASSNLL